MIVFGEHYRSAIVLNNMAVTMMERHCYKDAFTTLKDAVFCMKCATSSASKAQHPAHFSPSDADYENSPQDLAGTKLKYQESSACAPSKPRSLASRNTFSCSDMLRRAVQRTSRREVSCPIHRTMALPDTTCPLSLNQHLSISSASSFPSDSPLNMIATTTATTSSAVPIIRPIRIDDVVLSANSLSVPTSGSSSFFVVSSRNTDLYTAIILYNFGLTYICRSQQTQGSDRLGPSSAESLSSSNQTNMNHQQEAAPQEQDLNGKLMEHGIHLLLLSRALLSSCFDADTSGRNRASNLGKILADDGNTNHQEDRRNGEVLTYENEDEGEICGSYDDASFFCRLLFTSAILLQALSKALFQVGRVQAAREASNQLDDFLMHLPFQPCCHYFSVLHRSSTSSFELASAAAAA